MKQYTQRWWQIKLQKCTKQMTIELCKLIYWINKKIEKI